MEKQVFEADYSDDDENPQIKPQNGIASFKANGCKREDR
jgi:hypothetical protein